MPEIPKPTRTFLIGLSVEEGTYLLQSRQRLFASCYLYHERVTILPSLKVLSFFQNPNLEMNELATTSYNVALGPNYCNFSQVRKLQRYN